MGMVAKQKKDFGGGPVFANVTDVGQVKLCVEMPHVNAADRKQYFENGGEGYFNPVLVFFELRTHTRPQGDYSQPGRPVLFSDLFDDHLWLLTRRDYKGVAVCYHETVLYELIGNSAHTNVVFAQVPRLLFNPHKSYLDTLGKRLEDYGLGSDVPNTIDNAGS